MNRVLGGYYSINSKNIKGPRGNTTSSYSGPCFRLQDLKQSQDMQAFLVLKVPIQRMTRLEQFKNAATLNRKPQTPNPKP